eukprot:scaffold1535_cov382-Prasinococcus_capsulatus_cf.AAC.29
MGKLADMPLVRQGWGLVDAHDPLMLVDYAPLRRPNQATPAADDRTPPAARAARRFSSPLPLEEKSAHLGAPAKAASASSGNWATTRLRLSRGAFSRCTKSQSLVNSWHGRRHVIAARTPSGVGRPANARTHARAAPQRHLRRVDAEAGRGRQQAPVQQALRGPPPAPAVVRDVLRRHVLGSERAHARLLLPPACSARGALSCGPLAARARLAACEGVRQARMEDVPRPLAPRGPRETQRHFRPCDVPRGQRARACLLPVHHTRGPTRRQLCAGSAAHRCPKSLGRVHAPQGERQARHDAAAPWAEERPQRPAHAVPPVATLTWVIPQACEKGTDTHSSEEEQEICGEREPHLGDEPETPIYWWGRCNPLARLSARRVRSRAQQFIERNLSYVAESTRTHQPAPLLAEPSRSWQLVLTVAHAMVVTMALPCGRIWFGQLLDWGHAKIVSATPKMAAEQAASTHGPHISWSSEPRLGDAGRSPNWAVLAINQPASAGWAGERGSPAVDDCRVRGSTRLNEREVAITPAHRYVASTRTRSREKMGHVGRSQASARSRRRRLHTCTTEHVHARLE